MTKELSAAPRGAEQTPARKIPHNDDLYRKFVVQELALHLTRGGALLERCQDLAEDSYGDKIGAINAAAHLISAHAKLAKALAEVAQVERRTRTIVETVQRPNPEIAGLNAGFSAPQREKIRDALERALLQFLAEQKKDREKLEDLAIGSSI